MFLKIQKSILTNNKRYFVDGVLSTEQEFLKAREGVYATLIEDNQLHTLYKI